MPFVTSCFNRTILRYNLRQYWILWSIYTGAWLCGVILPLWNIAHTRYYTSNPLLRTKETLLEVAICGMPPAMTACFAIVFAMATCSYLCNSRSVNAFHSFPCKRETLFGTQVLSGLTFFVLPHTLILLLALLEEVMLGVLDVPTLLLWYAVVNGEALFFYAFTVCIIMLTGQLLFIPILCGVFHFLAVALEFLVHQLCGHFLYGWVDSSRWISMYLSPTVAMYEKIHYVRNLDELGNFTDITLTGGKFVILYALVGVVLLALSLVLYRLRHSETAGDAIVFPKLKPIFRYGVGVCSGLAFGEGVYAILFEYTKGSTLGYALCLGVCGMIGYFGAEMLLQKSVKLPKQHRLGALVVSLPLMLLPFALQADFFGYAKQLPASTEVKSATMSLYSYDNKATEDFNSVDFYVDSVDEPAAIDALLRMHGKIIADRKNQSEMTLGETNVSCRVHLIYTLADGTVFKRMYHELILSEEDVNRLDSLTETIQSTCNQPDLYRHGTLQPSLEEPMPSLLGGEIYLHQAVENGIAVTREEESLTLNAEQAEALRTALLKDIQTIPVNFFSHSSGLGSLSLRYEVSKNSDWELQEDWFSLTTDYTAVMEYLRELGLLIR